MSHGSGGDSSADPNLTPLLDLVLQLLMFFMVCVNFTDAVTNTGERLPWSETVKPLTRDGIDPIVLSVKPFRMTRERDDFTIYTEKERDSLRNRFRDDEACVFIPTETLPPKAPRDSLIRKLIDMREALRSIAAREARNKANVAPNGKIKTPIHIRADRGVKNGEIYELTQICKDAGFNNVKVRAILGTKERK